jgi:hypothetical protein
VPNKLDIAANRRLIVDADDPPRDVDHPYR